MHINNPTEGGAGCASRPRMIGMWPGNDDGEEEEAFNGFVVVDLPLAVSVIAAPKDHRLCPVTLALCHSFKFEVKI